jgi:hypothetical protein
MTPMAEIIGNLRLMPSAARTCWQYLHRLRFSTVDISLTGICKLPADRTHSIGTFELCNRYPQGQTQCAREIQLTRDRAADADPQLSISNTNGKAI